VVGWTAELTGWDTPDASQLVSQAGLAPVGDVAGTCHTRVGKLAERYLPGAACLPQH
jgi:amidase